MTSSDTTPPDTPRRRLPWWTPWLAALALAALVIGVGSYIVYGRDTPPASMSDTMGGAEGLPPPVTGYYEGQQIQFLHTEASDADVTEMLTGMMNSPVFHVPSLAQAPDAMLGRVFVFTNGIKPDGPAGPFGFQPDVFDTVPGDKDYTPLRSVHLVEWASGAEPHVLKTAADVANAERAGDVDITAPGVVVNMPITTWPDGHR